MNRAELIKFVCGKLNIDEGAADETRVADIIDDMIPYMNDILGAEYDYSAPGNARMLFINACMYEFNDALDDFAKNYLGEIIKERMKNEVGNDEE